jgi:transcriptional regulator with XRE-family HTH domain
MVRQRRLAAELRRLREAAGLTCEETAARLDCSVSKVSRIETGRVHVSPRDVRDLLRIYGVPEEQRDKLIQLAREARQKGWWQAYRDSMEPHLASYFGLEDAASRLRLYRISRIPGLLQTQDYSRAFHAASRPRMQPPDTERSVALLTERQRQAGTNPPELQVILCEAALRCQAGSPEVLRGQIKHLITASTTPGITVQVLPYASGLQTSPDVSFTILGFPDPADRDIVCVPYPTGVLWVEDDAEVDQYDEIFRSTQSASLPPADSTALMSSMLSDL